MNFSVKAINFSSQTNLNSSSKNTSCQPIKDDFGIYKVNFGKGESHAINEHGDSVSLNSKSAAKCCPELPVSFGKKFLDAAMKVAEKFKGDKADSGKIGKGLAKEIYGVEIN